MKKKIIMICILLLLIIGIVIFLFFNNKNENIKKITIRYYPLYNIATAEGINEVNEGGKYVEEVKFDLSGDDFKKAKDFLSKIKPTNFDFESCDCEYMMDEYEIYINDKTKISMGYEFGKTDEFTFDIDEEFSDYMYKLMSDYNDKYVYKKIESDNISIEMNGEIIEVKDNLAKETILGYKYFEVNEKEDYLTYSKGPKAIILLDNNTKIYLYEYSIIGYLESPNKSTFIVFDDKGERNIYACINNVVLNYRLDLNNKLNTNVIKVEYKGKKYEITDVNKINEIRKELLTFDYSRPSYYFEGSEEIVITEDDIKISINKCNYYIPDSKYIGNRFFIDEDGKMYSVNDLGSSNTEKYIKELIGYKE